MQMVPSASQAPRQVGAVERFAERLLARGRVAFGLAELTASTQLSSIAAKNQILRLHGKIVRVSPRRQFFLVVAPEHRALGAPPVTWWLHDYFKWLGHPYYVALQSAAALHGSQPQAIQTMQVMTDEPRREIELGRIRIRFFVKSKLSQTPTQQLPGAHARLFVSTPEATALDLVLYADRIGGIERAMETIEPMLHSMRTKELRSVLRAARASAVVKLASGFKAAGDKRLAESVRRMRP